MSFKVLTIPPFDKQLKRLAKKHPSVKQDFAELLESLRSNPMQGIEIKVNCFKIRMAIKSKGKGKSGGARIITTIFIEDKIIYLLNIYDKSDKVTLTDKELENLLNHIPDH